MSKEKSPFPYTLHDFQPLRHFIAPPSGKLGKDAVWDEACVPAAPPELQAFFEETLKATGLKFSTPPRLFLKQKGGDEGSPLLKGNEAHVMLSARYTQRGSHDLLRFRLAHALAEADWAQKHPRAYRHAMEAFHQGNIVPLIPIERYCNEIAFKAPEDIHNILPRYETDFSKQDGPSPRSTPARHREHLQYWQILHILGMEYDRADDYAARKDNIHQVREFSSLKPEDFLTPEALAALRKDIENAAPPTHFRILSKPKPDAATEQKIWADETADIEKHHKKRRTSAQRHLDRAEEIASANAPDMGFARQMTEHGKQLGEARRKQALKDWDEQAEETLAEHKQLPDSWERQLERADRTPSANPGRGKK